MRVLALQPAGNARTVTAALLPHPSLIDRIYLVYSEQKIRDRKLIHSFHEVFIYRFVSVLAQGALPRFGRLDNFLISNIIRYNDENLNLKKKKPKR